MDVVIMSQQQQQQSARTRPRQEDDSDHDSGNYSSSEDEDPELDNQSSPIQGILGDEWTVTNVISGVVGFMTASTVRQRLYHIGGTAFWLSTATLLVQFNVITINWPLIDRYTRIVSRRMPKPLKRRLRSGWQAVMQVPMASFFVGGFCLGAQFG